ncbi:hypothetical protein AX17_002272 [Amanita inopinata Kibby_2008]|nr:hypothetical protein AX17_002272 [Amanita inopinata Kibby_2008]
MFMSWLAEIVPSPHARRPLNGEAFLRDLLPVFLLYYITAFLVLIRGTLKVRIALLPVTLWLAFRAATGLDVVAGCGDDRLVYLNHGFSISLTTVGMRVISWTFQQEPFIRHPLVHKPHPVPNGSAVNNTTSDIATRKSLALDALELCCNLRGCGWNWSKGLHIPQETRPTTRAGFAYSTALSFLVGVLFFDCLHLAVQSFEPDLFMLPIGGSIYDPSLSPIPRYLRSSAISLLSGLTFYSAIQLSYHLGTLIGILVLRQHPSQWPPLFQYPWQANSLSDFWAKYWHQLFRHCFISLGHKPMSFLAGRVAGVLGAFLVSSMLHDFGLWGMGKGTDFMPIYTFFMMMGVGIVLEYVWKDVTGYRVGGVLGKAWLAVWLVGWSNFLIDAYCRKGLIASVFFPDGYRPTQILQRLIRLVL